MNDAKDKPLPSNWQIGMLLSLWLMTLSIRIKIRPQADKRSSG